MRKILCCLLLLCILLPASACAAEKYDALPDIFAVTVNETKEYLGTSQAIIRKEYLTTACPAADAALREIVDDFDARLRPLVKLGAKKQATRDSALTVAPVWYRTGDAYLSALVLGSYEYHQQLEAQLMTTRTFDLRTGERILLTDLFAADSPAWDLLAAGVRETLTALYPGQPRDEAALEALCTREALAQADFTLSGMELTLHYPAALLFPEKLNLMRVRFFYPQLQGAFTETGLRATDNSRWKFVAITCDDGPKDYNSSKCLTAFRQAGARVTYFIVGKQLERYGYLFIRQQDHNQLFGCHSFRHIDGFAIKQAKNKRAEIEKMDAVTLQLTGERARYFRCPGGTYNGWITADLPLPLIQWSLDTKDFTGKKPKQILYAIRDNVKEGDIILIHDTGRYEPDAIPIYTSWLTNHGFMPVTLDELAWSWGIAPEANVVYRSFRPGERSE